LPRDFRNGQYKFVSTPGGTGLARHDDLVRVTRHGIEGTSMPAFKLLPDAEHDLLATAVTHLSLRGRSEIAALRALLAGDESDSDNDITAAISAGLKTALRRQVDVERQAVPAEVPDLARSELEESVVRGLRLFTDPAGAGCAGCHVDFGRKSAYRYDVWGAAVRPNDLTAGVYKGGRRPEDVFWRIRCGVNPAGMPAAALLSDDDVRDLVRFVRALPDKQALPADVRATVYGD
jgi:mono/diheme cytochrome c family protein